MGTRYPGRVAVVVAGRLFIAGGTGGVGQHVVRKARERGWPVRLLVRDAARARELLGEELDLVVGDVRQPEIFRDALAGVDAVICTIGQRREEGATPKEIDYQAVRDWRTRPGRPRQANSCQSPPSGRRGRRVLRAGSTR